eukprot:11499438-Alexandrium_andersonii.AAC.1
MRPLASSLHCARVDDPLSRCGFAHAPDAVIPMHPCDAMAFGLLGMRPSVIGDSRRRASRSRSATMSSSSTEAPRRTTAYGSQRLGRCSSKKSVR